MSDEMQPPEPDGDHDFDDEGDFSGHGSPFHQDVQDGAEQVVNQPFDEAVSLSEESSVSDESQESDGQEPEPQGTGFGDNSMMVTNQSYDEAISISDATSVTASPGGHEAPMDAGDSSDEPSRMSPPGAGAFNDDSESSSSSDSDDDEVQAMMSSNQDGLEQEDGPALFKPIEGGYDPAEYQDLDASEEVKDLFMYITRYQAQKIELECALKPFIPEFIPSVGDIDAFLRVPRPDGSDDHTGLRVLDEPAAEQTDRTVLEMQLRAFTKQSGLQAQSVASIPEAQSNPAAIKKWIQSVEELHASKPPTGVSFAKPMPDIESLMQVWPAQFEEMLSSVPLPPPHLEASPAEYARMCCALLDIPVHDNVIHSLHTLCMLYSEFKGNQHFGAGSPMAQPPGAQMNMY